MFWDDLAECLPQNRQSGKCHTLCNPRPKPRRSMSEHSRATGTLDIGFHIYSPLMEYAPTAVKRDIISIKRGCIVEAVVPMFPMS